MPSAGWDLSRVCAPAWIVADSTAGSRNWAFLAGRRGGMGKIALSSRPPQERAWRSGRAGDGPGDNVFEIAIDYADA